MLISASDFKLSNSYFIESNSIAKLRLNNAVDTTNCYIRFIVVRSNNTIKIEGDKLDLSGSFEKTFDDFISQDVNRIDSCIIEKII